MPTCLRCGCEWNSFQKRPKVCVRCKSYWWDTPRVLNRKKKVEEPKKEKKEEVNMGKYLKEQMGETQEEVDG